LFLLLEKPASFTGQAIIQARLAHRERVRTFPLPPSFAIETDREVDIEPESVIPVLTL
jgi:hypothetical protein